MQGCIFPTTEFYEGLINSCASCKSNWRLLEQTNLNGQPGMLFVHFYLMCTPVIWQMGHSWESKHTKKDWSGYLSWDSEFGCGCFRDYGDYLPRVRQYLCEGRAAPWVSCLSRSPRLAGQMACYTPDMLVLLVETATEYDHQSSDMNFPYGFFPKAKRQFWNKESG